MKKSLARNGCVCALLLAFVVVAPGMRAAEARDPLEPLAFLVGHCWQGTFAGGDRTDVHCFSRIYGGKFLRDEHTVRRADGRTELSGESVYLWDSAARQLQYFYFEDTGGFTRGTVTTEKDALVFPPSTYIDNGQSLSIRSRWQRAGDDAYDVVTEFEVQGRWVPGFAAHMQKVRNGTS